MYETPLKFNHITSLEIPFYEMLNAILSEVAVVSQMLTVVCRNCIICNST